MNVIGINAAQDRGADSQDAAVTVQSLDWKAHGLGGERAKHEFPNGYTASVIRGGPFYTTNGTYEIAVLSGGRLDYTTPITDDVLGYLSEEEANETLALIGALPAPAEVS